MELQMNLGSAGSPSPARDPGAASHILLLGAYAGRVTTASGAIGNRLLEQHVLPVDAFDIDAAIARVGPAISLEAEGSDTTLTLRSLDDFHPDALCRLHPQLLNIIQLKKALADHGRTDAAIAAAQDLLGDRGNCEAAQQQPHGLEPPANSEETDDDTMARLLGAPRQAASENQPVKSRIVERLIADAAGSTFSVNQDEAKRLHDGLAILASRVLRETLGEKQFQQIETAWRSLDWFAGRLDADAKCELSIFAASLDQLRALIATDPDAADDLKNHIAREWREQLLNEQPSLIVAQYPISGDKEGLAVLKWLMSLARESNAPVFAGADASLAGLDRINHNSRLVDRNDLHPERTPEWDALRAHPSAGRTAVGFPEIVLRQPYGSRSDPIDTFSFEELAPKPDRAAFLWAPAAIALASLWLQARTGEQPRLDDMPLVVYDDGGGQAIMPSTEFYLSDSAATALSTKGICTLRASRNSTSVIIDRIRTVDGA